MTVPNQMSRIVAEDILTAGGALRSNNIDGFMFVHVLDADACQLFCNAGAKDLRSIQTKDCVDDSGSLKIFSQLFCGLTGFSQTVFGICHVNIVIDMTVIRCEMPFCNAERNAAEITAEMGGRNNHSVAHPFFVFRFWERISVPSPVIFYYIIFPGISSRFFSE